MLLELSPRELTWDEVDPARHPFDRASAAEVVRSLGPARRTPRRPDLPPGDPALTAFSWEVAMPWTEAVSYALEDHYGRWSLGWRWAHGEGDFDGGPVGSWCCFRHSVTTPEETLDRVAEGLCEWREWLETLSRWFEAYPLDLDGIEDQRVLWECAARNLIFQVVDRTGCASGWYGHCAQVLTWFLTRWGVAPDLAHDLVDEAIGGRFHSWTHPRPVLVDEVAERLPRTLRPGDRARPADGPPVDHLERWLTVRAAVAWQDVPDGAPDGPVRPALDGAADDIAAFDAAIDPARAEGLLAALARVRADAASGAPLDFALLRGWQQHVLGSPHPPAFRTLPAFAKHGRERYGIAPGTRARLDACLAESTRGAGEAPLPLPARAVRAYLDVCFFHPFDDGNARCAFLALVFVLAREGAALDSVGFLRRLTCRADAPEDAEHLAAYLARRLSDSPR